MNIMILLNNYKIFTIVFYIFYPCVISENYDMMTDEEIYRVFHTDRYRVPTHEFIQLKSLSITQVKQRYLTENRILSFTAFRKHFNIQLKLRDNVLFGKNTPIWHVKSNPLNYSEIKYTQLTNILDIISGIYQDPDNLVSLLETKIQENGEVFYDGIISANLAISPLPQRFINLLLLSNNSISNNVNNHVVFKIYNKNSTSDYTKLDITSTHNTIRKYNNLMRKQALKILYPEILVVVDASFYKHLGKHPYLAMNYLIPFWNGVDLRYKLLRSPEVKLNIAGIILAQDEIALRFLYNNLDENGRIHAKKALIDAGKYFNNDVKFIKRKDIIVIMTKRDICSLKYTNYCKSSTLGKAFTGKVCSKKKNTAIFEDNGGYTGIITATHEIGHLLGLPHDGEEEALHCSVKDGYIMASAKFRSVNSVCWSSCSEMILQKISSSTAFDCLENKPENVGESVPQILPGKILTLEEQCLARGGKPCIFNATVCWKLHCTKSMTNMKCIGKAPAAEGSACGDGLYCINGECTTEETTTLQNNL